MSLDKKNGDDGLYHHFIKSMKKEEEKLKENILLRGSKAIEFLVKNHVQKELIMSKLYIFFLISSKDAYEQYRAYRIHLFIELLRDWTAVKLIKMSQEWKEMLDNNPDHIFFVFTTIVSEKLKPTIELMSISGIPWYSFKKAYFNLQKSFQNWIAEKDIVFITKTSKLDLRSPVTILKKKEKEKEKGKELNYMKIDVQKANWTSLCFIYQVVKKEQLPTWEKMIDGLTTYNFFGSLKHIRMLLITSLYKIDGNKELESILKNVMRWFVHSFFYHVTGVTNVIVSKEEKDEITFDLNLITKPNGSKVIFDDFANLLKIHTFHGIPASDIISIEKM